MWHTCNSIVELRIFSTRLVLRLLHQFWKHNVSSKNTFGQSSSAVFFTIVIRQNFKTFALFELTHERCNDMGGSYLEARQTKRAFFRRKSGVADLSLLLTGSFLLPTAFLYWEVFKKQFLFLSFCEPFPYLVFLCGNFIALTFQSISSKWHLRSDMPTTLGLVYLIF